MRLRNQEVPLLAFSCLFVRLSQRTNFREVLYLRILKFFSPTHAPFY